MPATEQPNRSKFPPTRWTLVEWAANPSSAAHEKGLNDLLCRYLPALKAHLTRSRRLSPDFADDVAQGFIADKILRGELLAHAQKERGKFRTFLLTALDRYLFNILRHDRAKRRAPEHGPPIPLDGNEDYISIPAASPIFDLAWAREVINETLRRMAHNCRETDRAPYWILFEDRFVNPLLHCKEPQPYRQFVTQLGFRSPMQASNALTTAKRMFERVFREVVLEYAEDKHGLDREIAELRAILAEASG